MGISAKIRRGKFIKRDLISENDSLFRCSGKTGERELPTVIGAPVSSRGLRFQSSSDLLSGSSSTLRFQSAQVSHEKFVDWGKAEWDSIKTVEESTLTSFSLIPKPCRSVDGAAA